MPGRCCHSVASDGARFLRRFLIRPARRSARRSGSEQALSLLNIVVGAVGCGRELLGRGSRRVSPEVARHVIRE